MKAKHLTVSIMTLLLAGCAHRGSAPIHFTYQPPNARQAQLQGLTTWQSRGVMGLRNLTTNKGAVVNYRWNQSGDQYRIDFSAALNFVNATLQGKPGSVNFRQGNKYYRAKSIAQLMQQQLGWSLPISDLQYWIKGQVAPGAATKTYNQFGQLQSLVQDGWRIQYFAYTQQNHQDLPERMTIINPQFNVRIVIKQWSI